MGLQILCFAILFLCVVYPEAALEPSQNQSHCESQCGDQSVPYPFGLENNSHECFINSSYKLSCNHSFTPPKLFFSNVPIFNISVETATATVHLDTAYTCYNKSGVEVGFSQTLNLTGWPFTISSTLNTFMAIGCDTVGLLSYEGVQRGTGCLSVCDNSTSIRNLTGITQQVEPCSEFGCCQTTKIPKGLKFIEIDLLSLFNHTYILASNPCDIAFLTAGPNANLVNGPEHKVSSQVVLDWTVGDTTCDKVKNICGHNTNCTNSNYSSGYRCSCWQGYAGNPYTVEGCKDMNECANEQPCKQGTCKNTPGNYTCQCPFGYQGDGKVGCSISTASKIIIGTGAFIFLVAFVLFLHWRYKKKIQEKNHRKNGGLLLGHLSLKDFKETQLVKATNNFDARRLLGEGGNGWVYKGSIENMIEIAVKKSKGIDQNKIEQFLNEADVVSKINHKNVVKLLGVCLESKVPMLVYEFVPNGTLSHHIYASSSRILSSWRICLKIVAETARALDYMHSDANPPIIHRDVKPSNILLDETYTAKVSDFGASKLIPKDRTIEPTTQGQGTFGYFDPEFFQTGELTTKSDVYGFGVVLMELLSKQKPLSRGQSGESISLVQVFTSALENNQLDQVLKVPVATERETEDVKIVANLAVRCVSMSSKDRPTMTEVADVLNGLSKEYRSSQVEGSGDEMVSLLDEQDVMSASFDLEYSSSV
ncbi:hypothetical protein AQUCO_01300758v1 [Aquilegia coerulea]|uniref:Protein kinase domain-containing protein n=1 Tax=Aquilegia coerulea TaxID=218851 RepID=A0A2G5E3C0_AQUCA|nr:hypothetical protein AQUCO_01300758v1 [Aquilegia coerulea]